MKTALIFDLDGTLLDTLQDLADGVNHVLQSRGCKARTLEEIRCFVGNGAEKLMAAALPENYPELAQALGEFRAFYGANCQVKTAPYEGILEALQVLKEKYPLAIVSNKPHFAVKSLCADYFPGIPAWGEAEGCPRKPAPDMVRRAMNALGAESCIYIGDSEVDVLTAKNAGVPCLSVTWGFRDRDTLTQAGATHFCRQPKDLPDAIEKLLGETYGQ